MRKRILVIDDEMQIRKIYVRLFQAIGSRVFEVIEAANATEATNYLIREHFDVVLLDIKMPGVNGLEMFEVIKEYNPKLKVIVASVYPIEIQKNVIPYAEDYYDKSQGPFKLIEKVASTLFPHQEGMEAFNSEKGDKS